MESVMSNHPFAIASHESVSQAPSGGEYLVDRCFRGLAILAAFLLLLLVAYIRAAPVHRPVLQLLAEPHERTLIYNFSSTPFENQIQLVWAASLVLVLIILVFNVLSRLLGRPKY